MNLRNLRLKRGWSQSHLAEVVGVSVRTIQRLEQGDKAGIETALSLASVLDVDVSEINPESINEIEDTKREAAGYVKGIKEFYSHLCLYLFLAIGSLILWGFSKSILVWAFIFWTAVLTIHGLVSFDKATFIGPKWEKRIIEKRIGRKL